MAISKTPKKKAVKQQDEFEQEDVPSIFEHFGLAQSKDVTKKEVVTKDDRDDKIDALNRRLDELQRANVALMSQPSTSVQAPTAPKDLDLSGLPDPVADPDKYASELNKRINDNMKARTDFTQSNLTLQQEQQRKLDALWNDFGDQYEDIAKDEDRVKFIAGQLLEEAKGRGLDTQKYVLSGREQFFGDIAKRYEKVFGKTTNEEDTEDEVPEDDGRATSILGGLESGFQSGTKPGKQAKEQLGSLEKDISDIQRKSGFY